MGLVVDPRTPPAPTSTPSNVRPHPRRTGRRHPSGAPAASPMVAEPPAATPTAAWSRAGSTGDLSGRHDGPARCSSRTGASSSRATPSAASPSAPRAPLRRRAATAQLQRGRLRRRRPRSAVGHAGVNPCGDPTDEGGALRSQDVRIDRRPAGLDGAVLRVDPDTGRRLAGQRQRRERTRTRPEDHRVRPAQPVPHDGPGGRQRLDRRGRSAPGRRSTRSPTATRPAQLRLAVSRGRLRPQRVQQPRHTRCVISPPGARRPASASQPAATP